MNLTLRLTVLLIGAVFSFLSVYLLVKKRNSERNTVLWLLGSLLAFGLSADPGALDTLADWVGVSYPPALLFLVTIVILLFIVLNQSIQISALNAKVKEIGQEVALLPSNRGGGPKAADADSQLDQRSVVD